MRIVFMGTPDFSVPSLKVLCSSSHEIVATITVPDRKAGRGLKYTYSAVKKASLELGLTCLQPDDLSATDFIDSLRQLAADVFVVVAFRILPASIFEMPSYGTVNLHSSLLPKYRGAAPINWAIINGEKSTGVSTIFINQQVDTGDLIFQEEVEIGNTETAGELHDRLAGIGARVLLKTIDAIASGTAKRFLQIGEATKAPKITTELANIPWSEPGERIRNLIRGLSPFPGAYTFLNGSRIKVYYAGRGEVDNSTLLPGEVVKVDRKTGILEVATGDGTLLLHELQPEGKRRMAVSDFLLGYAVKPGDKFAAK